MKLTAELIKLRTENQGATREERAQICCQLARKLEKSAEYELAYEALSEFWPDLNQAPVIDDLDELTGADVIHRAGALAGWLGSISQTSDIQERGKNLLTQSVEIFEQAGQNAKAAEARGDLALCYWREGAFDEARINLASALNRLGDEDSDLKAILLIRAGIIEERTRRLQNAMHFYDEAEPLVESSDDHGLKGAFHAEYGLVFRRLAAPENREDYLDRALIEYAAASFHFEQAGNTRYLANVENNLGYLYFTIGRFKDAHKHLDRARHLFIDLKDVGMASQVDDTRARTLLGESRAVDAERIIKQAIRTLERGGEQAALAEALTTYGVVLARLGRHARSRELLDRAMQVAETAGDLEGAGRAKLSVIEELASQTPSKDLASDYEAAVSLLQNSEDPTTTKRLIRCALKLLDILVVPEPIEPQVDEISWQGFSFKREVLKIEKTFIERALRDAGGSVTKAARLLGFRHHQSLIALINSRHRDLLGTRSAVRKRRHHLFSKPRQLKKPTPAQTENDSSLDGGEVATTEVSAEVQPGEVG
ncbi:MAG TPA: helix-turn-helix domain-containing protein [Pyrinomonadaceae bacterium]|jgi:tetratricopeptide (TPR) repeat protein|nr:helix-turn-helix domain-containing protein [Pyrinomonadaceae bacterium]